MPQPSRGAAATPPPATHGAAEAAPMDAEGVHGSPEGGATAGGGGAYASEDGAEGFASEYATEYATSADEGAARRHAAVDDEDDSVEEGPP
jgi:hypothetical protein